MQSTARPAARRTLTVLAATAALALAAPAAATAAAAPAAGPAPAAAAVAQPRAAGLQANQLWKLRKRDSRYEIVNVHSDLCLMVKGGSRDNGAAVVQNECGTASEKLWRAEATDGGTYIQLRNAYSGKCLDISGGRAYNGAKLIQYDCTGALNQKWWDTDGINGDPGFWISGTTPSGAPTWMCMDNPGWSSTPGTQAAIWQCVS
ncbi:RICIN domain-containing protein [Streptomyces sp. NPDC093225]|uniref:RICIN domain-containing protein n=1 Tax=Streptomyces sp. NPDC093225 TaxID=3366034 RepID=UPI0038152706